MQINRDYSEDNCLHWNENSVSWLSICSSNDGDISNTGRLLDHLEEIMEQRRY